MILRDQPRRRATQLPYVRVPYPACGGQPRPHDASRCVHCREFIRANGPYLQELATGLNRLLDLVDGPGRPSRRRRIVTASDDDAGTEAATITHDSGDG